MPDRHQTIRKSQARFFILGSRNVGALHGRAGEIVETLNRIKIDICCVQEVRWRGASTRTATRKNSHYKLFWIGNKTGNGGVGIFVEKIEKVLEVKHVNDRLMMVKPQTYKRTAVAVLAYGLQEGRTNNEQDRFYESIVQLIASINEKDMVMIGGDLKKKDIYDSVHDIRVRNTEGGRVPEMGTA